MPIRTITICAGDTNLSVSAKLTCYRRFYCEPCEQCVCVLCALHEHNEHDVSSLADGLERHRGTFDALLDNCRTRIDAVRQQLTLADAFQSSLTAAEDNIRHAAIDAIAAVRKRESELLDGLRSFVGDDALRFLDERDTLGVRLVELDNVRQTTETMVGRTSVELLITKKEIHDQLRRALDRQLIRMPDRVRLGGVRYVAGVEPFRDLHQSTSDVAKLFRTVDHGQNVKDKAVENHMADKSSSSSSSSSSSDSDTDSEDSDSDSEDEPRQFGTVDVRCELPRVEHVRLVARSRDQSQTEEDGEDDDDSSDDEDDNAPVTKICISDGVVRRMVIKSQSLCDPAENTPPPRPNKRKIPDFSRPKPVRTYVDRGTEMEQVETTDAATATSRVVVCDKETYTGYIYLVHKNVSTDNQGTAEKGTTMATDVTEAYRNLSNSGRAMTCSRGTNTLKALTSDRASSPIAAPRSPTAPTSPPAAFPAKVAAAYLTTQRPGATQVPPAAQKSPTSGAVAVGSPQMPPVAGRVPDDAQKIPPRVTSLTVSSVSAAQAVVTTSVTTISQKPVSTVASSTAQAGPASSKLLPVTKPMTSSGTASASPSPVAATAPGQFVTSSTQPKTSLVFAVSPPSQQKLSPGSASNSTSATTTAVPSVTQVSSARAGTSSSMTSAVGQNPAVLPVTQVSSARESTTSSMTSTVVQNPAVPSVTQVSSARTGTTSSMTSTVVQNPAVPSVTQVSSARASTTSSMTSAAVQNPTASSTSVLSKDSPSQSAQCAATSQPALSAGVPQSVNNGRMQSASSTKFSVVTLPVTSASKPLAPPVTSTASVQMAVTTVTVSSPLPAPVQKLLTSEQASSARQTQPSPSRSQPTTLPPQSASVTSPSAQHVAMTSSSQNTSSVTQVSNIAQQRTSSTAPTPSPQQRTTTQPQPAPTTNVTTTPLQTPTSVHAPTASSVVTMTTTQTANKLVTSALLQSQPTLNTSPINVTSSTSLQCQPQTAACSTPTSNINAMYVSKMAQNPVTPLVSPTTQPQRSAAPATNVTTSPQGLTLQAATSNSHAAKAAATSVTPVSAAEQKSMAATAPSPTQILVSTAAQKPVTSLASSTTQSQRPTVVTTTTQSVTSQAAATRNGNHLANAAATSTPSVSTSAQKPMTSDNRHLQEAAASVTSSAAAENSASSSSSAAAAAVATRLSMTPASPAQTTQTTSPTAVSNSTTRRSSFRSISMDNLRAPAPVLRPPPPIMTTSVAAVTQRLNGGGQTNGGSAGKNNWRSNR